MGLEGKHPRVDPTRSGQKTHTHTHPYTHTLEKEGESRVLYFLSLFDVAQCCVMAEFICIRRG